MAEQDNKLNPQLEEGWKKALAEEFGAEYMRELKKKLVEEMKAGVVIYPPAKQIFNAFNLTPFDKVKVVILGQDPYEWTRTGARAFFLCAKRHYSSPVPA